MERRKAERKGMKERKEGEKHPRNKFLVMALKFSHHVALDPSMGSA